MSGRFQESLRSYRHAQRKYYHVLESLTESVVRLEELASTEKEIVERERRIKSDRRVQQQTYRRREDENE